MKQIVKNFTNLFNKKSINLFIKNFTNLISKNFTKLFNKKFTNLVNKKFTNLVKKKQIIKNFTNFINRTILIVKNKTNINYKVSNFNKFLITSISLLFLYLFYLLIPTLYDKSWVQSRVEIKLFDEFNINISTSSDFAYRILPSPHFLIKDSKMLLEDSEKIYPIADIKNLKVFVSQGNFFDKEKIKINEVIVDQANFSLKKNTIKLFNDFSSNKFSKRKIKINKSKIFFKDGLNEIISIVKINNAQLYFDDTTLVNIINFSGESFKVPFNINFQNSVDSLNDKKVNIKAKSLKLEILNQSKKINEDLITGQNTISFLNSKIDTKYNIKEKIITFKSEFSKIINSQINYNGQLVVNPFDLNLNISLDKYRLSDLLNIISIFNQVAQTELLFNENISIKTSVDLNSNLTKHFFQNIKINFNIINGNINFNNTKLIKKDVGLAELTNSNLFLENNKLILNTDVEIKFQNIKPLFSILQTNKKYRKEIKNILVNLDYDLLTNEVIFNRVTIDKNQVSDQFLTIIQDLDDESFKNLNKSKRVLNELFKIYEG
jgi:hypothetical protein